MKKVRVHVDRLILRGLAHQRSTTFAAHLQIELGKLLASHELANRLTTISGIPAVRINAASGRKPGTDMDGRWCARCIVKGLLR